MSSAPRPTSAVAGAGRWRRACSSDGLDGERGVLAQDRALELLEAGSRLEPQLLAHRLARAPEHLERGGLPVAAVEGEHELPAQPLAGRVLGGERLELGHQRAVTAELEVGLDPILERGEPELVQPRDLGLRERLVADVLVRRPAPQLERLAEGRRRRLGRLRAPASREALEPLEVELAGLQAQAIAGPFGHDPVRSQPPAQRVHLDLERVRRARRRALAPQRVDQPVARGDLAARDQQAGQERDLLPGRELDARDLHGSQYAEVHETRGIVSRRPAVG